MGFWAAKYTLFSWFELLHGFWSSGDLGNVCLLICLRQRVVRAYSRSPDSCPRIHLFLTQGRPEYPILPHSLVSGPDSPLICTNTSAGMVVHSYIPSCVGGRGIIQTHEFKTALGNIMRQCLKLLQANTFSWLKRTVSFHGRDSYKAILPCSNLLLFTCG